VEDWIGPIEVNAAGGMRPLSLGTAKASENSEAFATNNVAGGGFEPYSEKQLRYLLSGTYQKLIPQIYRNKNQFTGIAPYLAITSMVRH
jgi:hypothetical protein